MQTITTIIKREWLREIVAGRKKIEYREIKRYWERRLRGVKPPFLLRLINGISPTAPEVVVKVVKIIKNNRKRQFELYLGKIVKVKHWDARREKPRAK